MIESGANHEEASPFFNRAAAGLDNCAVRAIGPKVYEPIVAHDNRHADDNRT
jgi:hypothetical protein